MEFTTTYALKKLIMANDENIKPFEFKKGQSGNPKGRPVGSKNRSTIVKKWLETVEKAKNPISGESEDLSQEDMITLAILKKARTGDVRAYKELMDSLYGTAKDTIDINTNEVGIDFDELLAAMKKNDKQ
tara:strand:+ start:1410 stop:1799 length:390 start_codon:yes stop_codon:yes gene_type:complete